MQVIIIITDTLVFRSYTFAIFTSLVDIAKTANLILPCNELLSLELFYHSLLSQNIEGLLGAHSLIR